jgi:membrane-associated phospholipid phosphatase
MARKIFLSLILLILCSSASEAQFKYDFPQFYKETGHFYTTPLHWIGSDFLMIGALVAGTLTAGLLESPARDIIFDSRLFYNSIPATAGRMYGELYTPVILFAAYGSYSLATGDRTARKIAYELGQSCLYAASITITLKTIIGRARPLANEGKNSFHPLSGILDDINHSFPSGHVTEAFAMSTVLSMNADPLWLKILAYLPAAFTPFSRAYQGWHWISDCVFGAGIGYFTAKWCVNSHEHVESSAPKTGWIEVKSLCPLTLSMTIN